MNLDQFRQIKAQEKEQTKETIEQKPAEIKQETNQEEINTDKQEEKVAELPSKITIAGIGEVDIEELKNGYLRQTDYTKKTQEISNMKNEVKDAVTLYEFMRANPDVAKLVVEKAKDTNITTITPEQKRIKSLEDELMLQKRNAEIAELSAKDKDFNLVEVESVMESRNLKSLNDAYKIWKSDKATNQPLDLESLTKKIKDDLLKELGTQVDTRSIMNNGGTANVENTQAELTPIEKRIAKNLKMSEADYLRYKNIK